MNFWKTLGIRPTSDRRAIKRAYAAVLKQTRPEDDPQGYQRLREAFEAAQSDARRQDVSSQPLPPQFQPTLRDRPPPRTEVQDEIPRRHKPVERPTETTPTSDHEIAELPRVQVPRAPRPPAEDLPGEPTFIQLPRVEAPHTPIDAYAVPVEPEVIHPTVIETDTRDPVGENSSDPPELIEARRLAQELLGDARAPNIASRFRDCLGSDALLCMRALHDFEHELLNALVGWESTDFPGELARVAAGEFEWFHPRWATHPMSAQFDYLQLRQRCSDEKRRLEALLHDRTITKEMRDALGLLFGRLRPRWFAFVRLRGRTNAQITELLTRYETTLPEIFDYELATPSVAWWRERIRRAPLTLFHLLMGAVLAVAFSAPVLELIDPQGSAYPYLTTIVLAAIPLWTFGIWLLHRLLRAGFRHAGRALAMPARWCLSWLREIPTGLRDSVFVSAALLVAAYLADGAAADWLAIMGAVLFVVFNLYGAFILALLGLASLGMGMRFGIDDAGGGAMPAVADDMYLLAITLIAVYALACALLRRAPEGLSNPRYRRYVALSIVIPVISFLTGAVLGLLTLQLPGIFV